jgi:hypothetical protein
MTGENLSEVSKKEVSAKNKSGRGAPRAQKNECFLYEK